MSVVILLLRLSLSTASSSSISLLLDLYVVDGGLDEDGGNELVGRGADEDAATIGDWH